VSDLLNTVSFDYEIMMTSRVMLVDEQMDEINTLMEGASEMLTKTVSFTAILTSLILPAERLSRQTP
jgi:hypothetical protein